MQELANIGKMISLFIIIVLYGSGWAVTTAFLKGVNDETWVKIFSVIWLFIHGLAFIGFLIWSWI